MIKISQLRGFATGLCLLVPLAPGASNALAQTVPPPTAPAASSSTGDVIQLSAFEVSDNPGSGYATSSSMTVWRIATKITEVPVAALIINERLIEDGVPTSSLVIASDAPTSACASRTSSTSVIHSRVRGTKV